MTTKEKKKLIDIHKAIHSYRPYVSNNNELYKPKQHGGDNINYRYRTMNLSDYKITTESRLRKLKLGHVGKVTYVQPKSGKHFRIMEHNGEINFK